MRISAQLAVVAVACATVGFPALAGAELLLADGTTLSGISVELKQGIYFLEREEGEIVPVPRELVSELRLTGDDDPPVTGIQLAEAETLVGPEEGPRLPKRSEQTRVLDDGPKSIARGVIAPRWQPRDGWNVSSATHEFAPADWYRPPIDPDWTPRSAYRVSDDVTEFNPVHWYSSPINPTWWPVDGFSAEPRWFPPILQQRK